MVTGCVSYHAAHTLQCDMIIENIVSLVKENPPPLRRRSNRRRNPIHFMEKTCMYLHIDGCFWFKLQRCIEYGTFS